MSQTLHRLVLPSFRGAFAQHLPVLSVKARAAGPCVAVTANIHGDEATGVGAIHSLLDRLDGLLLKGEVLLYPSLNLPGLIQGTRALPADGQDLNRQFPGDPRGTASERHACAIWTDLKARGPELLLDLHADAPASIPYTLVDRASGLVGEERERMEASLLRLARATGLTVLHEYADEKYRRYHLDRSLSGAVVNRMKVPAVTLEAGPRRHIEPGAVDAQADAALRVLAELGMVEVPPPPHPSCLPDGPWRRSGGPRASSAGVLKSLMRPGDRFAAGQVIAEVRALEGRCVERLRAPVDGYVVSLPERAWITAGVSVGTHAVLDL